MLSKQDDQLACTPKVIVPRVTSARQPQDMVRHMTARESIQLCDYGHAGALWSHHKHVSQRSQRGNVISHSAVVHTAGSAQWQHSCLGCGTGAPLMFRSLSPSLRCFAAAETGGACAAARHTCLQCVLALDGWVATARERALHGRLGRANMVQLRYATLRQARNLFVNRGPSIVVATGLQSSYLVTAKTYAININMLSSKAVHLHVIRHVTGMGPYHGPMMAAMHDV